MPEVVPGDVGERLPALIVQAEQVLRPGEPETIAMILARLALHYRPPSEAVCCEIYEDYLEAIAGFSPGVVAEATRRWHRSEKWWPKLCELLEICTDIEHRERDRLTRLKFLLWCSHRFCGEVPRYLRSMPSAVALQALMAGERWAARLFVLPVDAPAMRSDQ